MYVASSAPIPGISTGPINPVRAAQYNARKQRVFFSVAAAASRYDCAAAIGSFQGFGINFLNQVQRARNLLNQAGTALSSAFPAGPVIAVPGVSAVQASVSSSDTSGAPVVVNLSPGNTNPSPGPPQLPANFTAPHWGDAPTSTGQVPIPLTAAARYPWVALGVMAALALAAGILDSRGGAGLGGRR